MQNSLSREFETSLRPLWLRIWRGVVLKALSSHAASLINVESGTLAAGWNDLDDERRRARLVPSNRATWDACIEHLMEKKSSRVEIIAAFENAQRRKPNTTSLRQSLDTVMPALLNKPITRAVVSENPFPAAWPSVADELARLIYNRNTPDPIEPEWSLLNGLTIAGLLAGSRLPRANHILQVVVATRNRIMSVRGSLIRIPDLIHRTGIKDVPVQALLRTGGVTLQHEPLTTLLAATAEESRKIYLGQGVVHERLGITGPSQLSRTQWGIVDEDQLVLGQDARFRLYEFTIIAYLALSCIEQLLRSWAHREGAPT